MWQSLYIDSLFPLLPLYEEGDILGTDCTLLSLHAWDNANGPSTVYISEA